MKNLVFAVVFAFIVMLGFGVPLGCTLTIDGVQHRVVVVGNRIEVSRK